MKRTALLALAGAWLAASAALAGGEIYGTITTIRGETITGPIRWDTNENFWDDLLDARKREEVRDAEDEGLQISLFGWIVGRFGRGHTHSYPQLTVPFGHIRSIRPTWIGGAEITFKDGTVIEAREGGDLGESMRGIAIAGPDGEVELEWDDIERIDFAPGPGPGRDAERLYGAVKTTAGTFEGFVVWDRDESLRSDILDGDVDRRRRKIAFGEIRSIEKLDNRTSAVVLTDGTRLEMKGTNDVNSGNRGLDLTVPGLGRVQVAWREFESVTFRDAPPSRRYEAFDGGRPLRGTVTTVGGQQSSGRIVWDRDEAYTWEVLDGESGRIDYAVPFESIRAIRPSGDRAAEVETTDGRKLRLEGSNDVDGSNRGIVVLGDDGVEREYMWEEVASVTFEPAG